MDTTRHSLLIRIRDAGDGAAWREFDAIYRPMLMRVARARGLGDADAEDVVQYCMAAVQKLMPTFEYDRSRGRFKSWLCTLVNNRVRNLIARRREPAAASGILNVAAAPEPSPEETFERVWMQEHLHHCLRQVRQEVDEATYTAFRRYVIDGEEVEQICASMSLSAGQLYKIKWKITQLLRAEMVKLLGEEALDEPLP